MEDTQDKTKPETESTRFNAHPKGLFYLFFAEMWERFSFYGLRALLILYMTSELLMNDAKAYSIYAAYFVLVYGSPIIGGFIADRILGNRKAIIIGGILITLGHLTLTIPGMFGFYFGLAFIIAGTGLFKANISTLLGQLYKQGDSRRDSGFTLFYMGINLGAFLSPLFCGYIGQTYGWHYGFGIASIGMLLGLITFLRGSKSLEDKGLPPNQAKLKEKCLMGLNLEQTTTVAAFVGVPFFAMLLCYETIFDYALPVLGIAVGAWLLKTALTSSKEERSAISVYSALLFFQVTFFSLFEQAGSSLTLFTERVVDRVLDIPSLNIHFEIPASQFQSLNPLFILLFGPIFASIWTSLGRKGRDPRPPLKFALALIQVALGFAFLLMGIKAAPESGMTGMIWLVLAYLFHTTGELCLSPVGLSMVTKIAPKRLQSTLMGVWFLSIAYANYLAGVFSKLAAVETGTSTTDSLTTYYDAFFLVIVFAAVMTVILFVITPMLNKKFKEIGY